MIDGTAPGVTIDAQGFDRVLHHLSGDLTLSDLTVTGGSAPSNANGGGILSVGSDLTLTAVTVTENQMDFGDRGGGISFAPSSAATLTVTNSVISDNLNNVENQGNVGGGLAVSANGDLVMTGTTVSGNDISEAGRGRQQSWRWRHLGRWQPTRDHRLDDLLKHRHLGPGDDHHGDPLGRRDPHRRHRGRQDQPHHRDGQPGHRKPAGSGAQPRRGRCRDPADGGFNSKLLGDQLDHHLEHGQRGRIGSGLGRRGAVDAHEQPTHRPGDALDRGRERGPSRGRRGRVQPRDNSLQELDLRGSRPDPNRHLRDGRYGAHLRRPQRRRGDQLRRRPGQRDRRRRDRSRPGRARRFRRPHPDRSASDDQRRRRPRPGGGL